jgi:hypothetical protein
MPSIVCSLGAFTVASLFYAWRAHHETIVSEHQKLRQRVTYLLWILANQAT